MVETRQADERLENNDDSVRERPITMVEYLWIRKQLLAE